MFGRVITLNEGLLVWYRLLLATLMFYVVLFVLDKLRKVQRRDAVRIAATGVLLALHWLFFYGSIKASNVSIGVVCLSLMSFFTALFDPLINRHRVSASELLFSLIGVAGIVLLYEMGGGFAGLSLLLPFYLHFFPVTSLVPSAADWGSLLALASLCTVCLYILQIQVLKRISAFTFNLTYNLEPIYSIILAMIIFGEAKDLNASFYAGLGMIFLSVVMQTLRVVRQMKKR